MVNKNEILNALRMNNDKLKDELGGVRVGTKSSTVEGAMWYTIDDDLYWSLYMCMNGSRIEIAYGQIKSRN